MKRLAWDEWAWLAVYLICLYLILRGGRGTPVAMRFWHGLAQLCQRGAFVLGRMGIAAEKAYWVAVEKARP